MISPVPRIALLAATATFGISVAVAQTATPPAAGAPAMSFADPPHKNLKVLPADIPRQQLISTMKFFSQSLGVRCTYCHVGTDGQPLSTFDFPSDAKNKKQIARAMMMMVASLNQKTLPTATGEPDAKVSCFTCHRGSTKPLTEPAPGAPNMVPAPPGANAPPAKTERGAG